MSALELQGLTFLCRVVTIPDKPTHELDDESLSPRANKRRRTDSGPDELLEVKEESDMVLEDQHEEDLAATVNTTDIETQELSNGSLESATDAPDPEVAAVLGSIIDRAERLEEQFALDQLPAENSEQPASQGVTFVKASLSLKIQSLPILDNLVSGPLVQTAVPLLTNPSPSLPKFYLFSPSLRIKTSRHLYLSLIQRLDRLMPPCARYSTTRNESTLLNKRFYRQPNSI